MQEFQSKLEQKLVRKGYLKKKGRRSKREGDINGGQESLHVSDKLEITDRFQPRECVGVRINSGLNRDITSVGINNFSNGKALAKDIRKLAYADTNYMTTINYAMWILVRNIIWHEYSNAIVSSGYTIAVRKPQ